MNKLEKQLFDNIKKSVENLSLKELKTLSFDLSKKYKRKIFKKFSSDRERLAYIVCRMPATFNVLIYSLREIKNIMPEMKISSVLDLGSGPATTVWAMFCVFENIKKVHLVEKDPIINLGKKLLKDLSFYKNLIFEKNDILKIKNYDFDLVCLSYVASELKKPFIERIIKRWFYSKSKTIIFLEPGTMYGFDKIKFIRKQLINLGTKIIAPCPNELKCPMPKNDWCHFYVRVKRTKPHKYLKAASLPYEDEKFSYVIATKEDVKKDFARILLPPIRRKEVITLTLCNKGRVEKEKIPRKDFKRYKFCQKLKWGDILNV
jgi:ribosomal protein RSM22 (predicted rRNA methylase)